MLTKQQLLDEAQRQKQALATIGMWRNWLFILTTVFLVLAACGLRSGGMWLIPGILAAVLTLVCFAALLLVDLSIRNGHQNVERLLDSLQPRDTASPDSTQPQDTISPDSTPSQDTISPDSTQPQDMISPDSTPSQDTNPPDSVPS